MVWASLFSVFEAIPKEINLMDAIRFVKSWETQALYKSDKLHASTLLWNGENCISMQNCARQPR